MRKILAAAAMIALASCGSLTPQQTGDAAACAAGLMAANATNASELLMAAQTVPACRALAVDAMQVAVSEVMARRGIR